MLPCSQTPSSFYHVPRLDRYSFEPYRPRLGSGRVLFLKLFHGYWEIWISGKAKNGKYIDDFLACEELKKVISEGLARCSDNCGHKCNGGQGYIVRDELKRHISLIYKLYD